MTFFSLQNNVAERHFSNREMLVKDLPLFLTSCCMTRSECYRSPWPELRQYLAGEQQTAHWSTLCSHPCRRLPVMGWDTGAHPAQ